MASPITYGNSILLQCTSSPLWSELESESESTYDSSSSNSDTALRTSAKLRPMDLCSGSGSDGELELDLEPNTGAIPNTKRGSATVLPINTSNNNNNYNNNNNKSHNHNKFGAVHRNSILDPLSYDPNPQRGWLISELKGTPLLEEERTKNIWPGMRDKRYPRPPRCSVGHERRRKVERSL